MNRISWCSDISHSNLVCVVIFSCFYLELSSKWWGREWLLHTWLKCFLFLAFRWRIIYLENKNQVCDSIVDCVRPYRARYHTVTCQKIGRGERKHIRLFLHECWPQNNMFAMFVLKQKNGCVKEDNQKLGTSETTAPSEHESRYKTWMFTLVSIFKNANQLKLHFSWCHLIVFFCVLMCLGILIVVPQSYAEIKPVEKPVRPILIFSCFGI